MPDQKQVALVTGAGRGIGRSIALELAGQGIDVALVARSTNELEAVAAEVRERGAQASVHAADLAQPTAASEVVAAATAALGPITILINNAAMIGPFGATWEVDPDQWVQALTINVVAPFRLSHAVLPAMREAGWGRIINISSGAARSPMERVGAYSTTKAALDMFSRQLGVEVEGSGISVISLYPGVVDTVMQTAIREQPAQIVGEGIAQRFRGFKEEGRLQEPDRPARLVGALVGPAGERFNGEIADIYTPEAEALLG